MTEQTDNIENQMLPKIGYDLEEAATILGISYESVRRLVKRGLLKPSRALRRPILSRIELERFLADTTGT